MPHEWRDSQQNCLKTYWVPGLKQHKMQPEFDPSRALEQVCPPLQASNPFQDSCEHGMRPPALCSAQGQAQSGGCTQAGRTTEGSSTVWCV